jgi:hypothetical protein
VALTLWSLGYPVQAMQRSQESLAQAQALTHTPSLIFARHFAASLHYFWREAPVVQAQAEALLTLATAQEFPLMAAISGGLLSAVISIRYILGFRKDNPNVFNGLMQNWPHF